MKYSFTLHAARFKQIQIQVMVLRVACSVRLAAYKI
jgi:hypothetical protein